MSALPLLLLVGGAAVVVMGKKKKPKPIAEEETFEEEVSEETADEGIGDDEALQYGKIVSSGVRRDIRGTHPWRIRYEADGYHAEAMMFAGPAAPVGAEYGVAASLRGAKELIRDELNKAIIDAGYGNEHLRDDPAPRPITKIGILTKAENGNLGGVSG